MMKDIDYGISDVVFGEDTIASKTVKFGDGNTLISSVIWEGVGAGICLVRNKSDSHKPFQRYEKGELSYHINESPESEKVYIVFDNIRSIDSLIAQLEITKIELERQLGGE